MKPRRDYRLKLIEATQGNQSILGCIVLAAIKKQPDNPPYFAGRARILSNGDVMCDFRDRDKIYRVGAYIGTDEELVKNVMGLCRHCDLTNSERIEFMAKVNHWIEHDYRNKTRIRKVMVVE